MSHRKIDADALLDLVLETLRNEIAPVLPPEKRYAAAMIGNAIEIARRDMAGEADEAEYALLDRVYDDGDGSLQRLAKDIRSGAVNEEKVPDLLPLVRRQIIAELAVRNPRFVKSRTGKK
jgi:hypothetical protein